MMRTNIPEKLSNIVKEIDDRRGASLTRLAVLKKWFERTERLSAFAIWIATRAVSRQGKTSGAAEKLFREVRGMLARIVHNWNLILVEHGLDIYLWHLDSPTYGYKLAADYCQHYHSRYGNGLIGPSRTKIQELVRFLFTIEAHSGCVRCDGDGGTVALAGTN